MGFWGCFTQLNRVFVGFSQRNGDNCKHKDYGTTYFLHLN